MKLSDDQRHALGAFIRAGRERLPVASTVRRRTAGWRREEVAQDSGISVTWYTWIEQGRDISISAGALSRLAATLRLAPAERTYLFELARTRDPAPPSGLDATVPAELRAALRALTVPAYLLDRLWCACDCNDAARHLFAPWLGGAEPNLLRFMFLDPRSRDFISDWPDRARRLLAEFRADTANLAADPEVQALIGEIGEASADFRRMWDSQAVLAREGGERRFHHPADGELVYEQLTLIRPGHPDHKLVMLLPSQTDRR